MQMPIAVGVLVAIIFLVVFSEWFYNMFTGWKEVIIDDGMYKFRIFGATVFSLFVIVSTFFGASYLSKCKHPTPDTEDVQQNCDQYKKIKINYGF